MSTLFGEIPKILAISLELRAAIAYPIPEYLPGLLLILPIEIAPNMIANIPKITPATNRPSNPRMKPVTLSPSVFFPVYSM